MYPTQHQKDTRKPFVMASLMIRRNYIYFYYIHLYNIGIKGDLKEK